MKKQLLALLGAVLFAAVASATTYTWKGGTGSPVAPCAWSDPANWEDSSGQNGYPNGDDADVSVTSAAQVFVKLTEDITVRKAQHSVSTFDKVVVISDDFSFTLVGVASTRCLRGFTFYCPFLYRADISSRYTNVRFCGNVSRVSGGADGSFPMAHSGPVVFSYDRFAESASAIRAYAFPDTLTFYATSFRFDAPRTTSVANSWKFKTTDQSKFIENAQGNGLAIPVGTIVTGPGIPDGTFVKRIFSYNGGGYVELSRPATASATSTLAFAPFSPKLTVDLTSFNHNGSAFSDGLCASQWREGDDVEVIVRHLSIPTWGGGTLAIGVDDGYSVPAKVSLWASNGMTIKPNVQLATAHLHFPEPDAQHTKSGLPDHAVTQKNSSSLSRFTVTNGVAASIFSLSNAVGRIIKDGAGTLTIPRTDFGATDTRGSLAVEAGTLELPAQDYALKAVSIGAGAVLKIAGTARMAGEDVTLASGAVLDGPFTLVLSKRSSISGVVFRNGAKVELASGSTVEPEPVGEVVGNPAFWVDMKRSQMVTQADYSGKPFGHTTGFSGTGVKEIWDVRKQSREDAYLFSTNSNDSYLPTLRDDSTRMGDGKPKYDRKYLHVYGNYEERKYSTDPADPHFNDKSTANVKDGDFHVWSRPVTKIRAIFQVCSLGDNAKQLGPYGGGQILGTSGRIYEDGNTHYMDWGRHIGSASAAFSAKLAPSWGGGGSDAVRYGRLLINGVEQDFATATYPYWTTQQAGAPAFTNYLPIVMVVIPDATRTALPAADSYSYIGLPTYACQGLCGNKLLSELIVYTNELTETEITKVSQYLMDKWLYGNVDSKNDSLGSVNASSGPVSVTVPADSSCLIDEIGDGTLTKDGAGEAYVSRVHDADSVLAVAGGTLTIRSRGLTDALVPTNGLRYSFDASDLDSLTWQDAGNGVTNVTVWTDTRGSPKAVGSLESPMTNPRKPTLVAKAALGGKPVVDFGAVNHWPSEEWGSDAKKGETPVLWFTSEQESDRIRSIVAVWGSEHGGGTIAGGGRLSARYKDGRFTLARGGTWGTDLIGSDATKALVGNIPCPMIAGIAYDQGWRYFRNGTSYNPLTTGFSGGFDTVSLVAYENFGVAGLSGLNSSREYAGGEQIGEYLAWERGLSPEQVRDVEAYLNYKWFGRTTPGYDGARVGALSVVSGATVRVVGGAPLTVGSLTLGGTVEGAVKLAANARICVFVNADGSTVSQSGADWDFTAGGTIAYSGDVDALSLGRHVIFTDVADFPLASWTLETRRFRPNRIVKLNRVGSDVVLDVAKSGLIFVVK